MTARTFHRIASEARLHPLWVVLPAAALSSLVVSILLMRQFHALGFFYLDDTLFNSDPKSMLEVLSHGARSKSILYPELRNSIHPYLWFYFGPFVRILAKIALAAGFVQGDEVQLRAFLGTFVIPLISAVQAAAFGVLLHNLGLSVRHIVLALALNLFVFSNLIFGAIPEHFAVSNLALTLLLIVAVRSLRAGVMERTWVWMSMAVLATGVTITNAVAFGIVHLTTALRSRVGAVAKVFARSALLASSVAVFVLISAFAVGLAIDGPLGKGSVRDDFVPRYIRVDMADGRAPMRIVAALGNAIAPARSDIRTVAPTPVPSPFDPVLTAPFSQSPYPTYTFEPANGAPPGIGPLGLAAIAMMLLGAGAMIARGGVWRATAGLAAGLIAYNMLLHSVWGDEFFVYSQHWITPSLLLMTGVLAAPRALRPFAEAALVLLVVALAWNNEATVAYLIASAQASAASVN